MSTASASHWRRDARDRPGSAWVEADAAASVLVGIVAVFVVSFIISGSYNCTVWTVEYQMPT
jgi:hypothetical protein